MATWPKGVSLDRATGRRRVFVSAQHRGIRHRKTKLLPRDTTPELAGQVCDGLRMALHRELHSVLEVEEPDQSGGVAIAEDWIDWPSEIERAAADPRSWLRRMLSGAQSRSRNKKIECSLTLEELKGIALRTGGRCELTGLRFSPTRFKHARMRPYIPTLDRITALGAYTLPNCRMVCAITNIALYYWGEELFRQMALGYVSRLAARQI